MDTNDYAYVKDPVNEFDLDGNGICLAGHNPKRGKKHGGCRGGSTARRAGRVLDNSWVQGGITLAACSTGVGCGIAIAGFTGWNAGRRLRRDGLSRSFVVGTSIDIALAAVPYRALRGLSRPSMSAFGRPLIYAQGRSAWLRSTIARRAAWNGVVFGGGIARGYIGW